MDRNKRTVGGGPRRGASGSCGQSRHVSRGVGAAGHRRASASKTVDVVVAQQPLPLGTRLTKDHVKLVKWPAETQVPGAFAKVDEVVWTAA